MSAVHIARQFLVVAVLAAVVWGQSYTASIRGVVTDASSASIPSAKILVTDVDRGVKFETQSDAAGRYVVPNLPPGNYTLAVEAAGFKRFVQSSFRLEVQQQATIDVQMQVGDLASTVEVTGGGAAAEHDDRKSRTSCR